MKMTLLDRSECFRGFLLLIGQDRRISPKERELLLDIGRMLDFERRFCEVSIDDLLENNHINSDPPVFSHSLIAESFLRDTVRIALVDDTIDPSELQWLVSIAKENGLGEEWLEGKIPGFRGNRHQGGSLFEIEKHI